jgi:5-methyltetrahydrofolate--homocysteine methyltransferase
VKMSEINIVKEATIAGNMEKTVEAVEQLLADGMAPADIIQTGLIEAMAVVGEKFKSNEIYVPEMLIAARAMKAGLAKLKPLMVDEEIETLATVVLGTVKGDLHDIGKNLVGIMMEGAGCQVIDLGVDITPEKFVEGVKTHRPQFVGLSALLTTTMPAMKDTIDALSEAGLRKEVKVLIGGAPVTQKYADEINADGYADNAAEVVDRIKTMSA